jgi:hypothetical protein
MPGFLRASLAVYLLLFVCSSQVHALPQYEVAKKVAESETLRRQQDIERIGRPVGVPTTLDPKVRRAFMPDPSPKKAVKLKTPASWSLSARPSSESNKVKVNSIVIDRAWSAELSKALRGTGTDKTFVPSSRNPPDHSASILDVVGEPRTGERVTRDEPESEHGHHHTPNECENPKTPAIEEACKKKN